MNSYLKKLVPHLAAISLFVIISFVFFSPVLQGKVLNQSDVVQSKGMEHEREFYKQKSGKEIYWTNSAFGGMPTYLLGSSFPHDYTLKIHKTLNFLPRPVNFLFLYFLSFYILMLVLKVDWKLAFLGSLAFGFSTYLIIIIGVGHLAKVRAIAYFPLIIAGILLVYEHKKYFLGFVLTTLAVSLEINTKHYQMTYYLMFAVLIFAIFYLYEAYKNQYLKKTIKESIILLTAALLALTMNLNNILPAREYIKYSIRGEHYLSIDSDGNPKNEPQKALSKEYITEYSYGILETLNLLIPRFMGGSNNENLGEDSHLYQKLLNKTDRKRAKEFISNVSTYWGKQPIVVAPAYIGAITILLAFIGLLFYNSYHKKWIITTIVFALLLSWGKNFSLLTDFFIDYIPLYNKFRAVSSIQVLIEFLVPVLAVLGLHSFFTSDLPIEKKTKKLFISVGSLSGLLFIFILIGKSLFTFESPMDSFYAQYGLLDALIADRQDMLVNDSIRSLLLIVITGLILYLFLKNKLNKTLAIASIALLIVLDLAGVDKRYVNEKSFVNDDYLNRIFTPSPIDKKILEDTTYYRVMNFTRNPLNDGLTSYFHKQLGGYHAAKPRRIQDIFDFYLSKEIQPEILNMYNVKYFIYQNEQGQTGIQINDSANGNAWFVQQLDFVENENEEVLKLKNFNSKNTAILNKKYQKDITFTPYKDSLTYIRLTSYHPEKLIYESQNQKNGFVVFSENFYKNGWNATIDGKKIPIYKVNYSLRGIVVPEGKHQIIFEFQPKIVKTSGTISFIAYLIFVLIIAFGLFLKFKKS